MFSLIQETERGRGIWPGISKVDTFVDEKPPGRIRTVTALFAAGGLMDFPRSRRKHVIYVMNENGATVARFDIGNDPSVPETTGVLPVGEPA